MCGSISYNNNKIRNRIEAIIYSFVGSLADCRPLRSGSLFLAGRRRAYPAVCQRHAHGRTCRHVRRGMYGHLPLRVVCNLCPPAEIAGDRYQQQQTLRASCISFFCFTIGIPVRTFRQLHLLRTPYIQQLHLV